MQDTDNKLSGINTANLEPLFIKWPHKQFLRLVASFYAELMTAAPETGNTGFHGSSYASFSRSGPKHTFRMTSELLPSRKPHSTNNHNSKLSFATSQSPQEDRRQHDPGPSIQSHVDGQSGHGNQIKMYGVAFQRSYRGIHGMHDRKRARRNTRGHPKPA